MACMGHNSQYMKRDKLDILLSILEISRSPIKKTHILYKANINFYQLTRYLDLLLGLEMLEPIDDPYKGYRTTQKGLDMINLFSSDKLTASAVTEATRRKMNTVETQQIQNL